MRPILLRPICSVALALCLTHSIARADDYSGYRIPEFRRQLLVLGTSGSWTSSRGASLGFQSQRSGFSSQANGSYQLDAQSDRLSDRLRVSASGLASRSRTLQDQANGVNREHLELRAPEEQADASLDAQRSWFSPGGGPGLTASASLSFLSNASRRDVDTQGLAPGIRSEVQSRLRESSREFTMEAGLSPGWGRVRDVSAVVSAKAIEDRLRRAGRLSRELTSEERQRLAQVLSLGEFAFSIHDRPTRYLWREVSRVLRESGALTGSGFDAEAVERSREGVGSFRVFPARSGTRFAVSFKGLSTGTSETRTGSVVRREYLADTLFSQNQSQLDSRVDDDRAYAVWGMFFDFSRPSGLFSQWDLRTSLQREDGRDRTLVMNSRLLYQRLVLDRWTVTGSASHQIASMVRNGQRMLPDWRLTASASLEYRVEDSWTMALTWSHTQNMYRPTNSTTLFLSPTSQRSNGLFLRMSWSPATWFHSDALDIHERRGRL